MSFKTFVAILLLAAGCCLLAEAHPWYGYDYPGWYQPYVGDYSGYYPYAMAASADTAPAAKIINDSSPRMTMRVWAPWTYASPASRGRFNVG